MIKKERLGELLVKNKIITPEQLTIALGEQKKTGEILGITLQRLGFVDEESVYLPILAEQFGVSFVQLKAKDIEPEAVAKIPPKFAIHYKIMPIEFEGDVLTIAMTKPLDIQVIDEVGLIIQCRLKSVLASEKDIVDAIRKYYGVGADTIAQMMTDVDETDAVVLEKETPENAEEATISKFLNQILMEAFRDRATDIHIEPFEDALKIRYRVDGVLYDTKVPETIKHFKDSINSRIKILSNLNIAEKRMPQDGRFKVKIGDIEFDLRVSFMPSSFGESVVLRILSSARLYNMEELGLNKDEKAILDTVIKKPHGIVFITGPTGSGKTTTLYSCLAQINFDDRKIITIEDPIEYQIKGITQVQINPKVGLTFAEGLRSMLRHDPDIMMVGEVRDIETAEIAIRVALTGHLVFSTLHTNDAASSITRLLDMGVDPYLISSSVECIIAQRLVRIICPKCKKPAPLTPDIERDLSELAVEASAGLTLYAGEGCEACWQTGFIGRQAIYEILLINDQIRNLVLSRVSAKEIRNAAMKNGMKTLYQSGIEKVKKGVTTPSEIIRVTQDLDT